MFYGLESPLDELELDEPELLEVPKRVLVVVDFVAWHFSVKDSD